MLLSLLLAVLLAACGEKAAEIRLVRAEGAVLVQDTHRAALETREEMALYDGYRVATEAASFGWMTLDAQRLAKLDENSAAGIERSGRALTLALERGSLFFNIEKPLEEEESLCIRSANMTVGVRGACGWLALQEDGALWVYLLEGTVECAVALPDGRTAVQTVSAGQRARMLADGRIEVSAFSQSDIPAFVQAELAREQDGPVPPDSASAGSAAQEDPMAPYADALAAMPASDGAAPGLLHAELLDFEGDGDPELLVISVEAPEAGGGAWVPLALTVYRGRVAEDAIAATAYANLQAGERITLEESDGRLFLNVQKDVGSGAVSHSYFGPAAWQDGWWYWDWTDEVWAIPSGGDMLYQKRGYDAQGGAHGEMADCARAEYEAVLGSYAELRALVSSADGQRADVPAR